MTIETPDEIGIFASQHIADAFILALFLRKRRYFSGFYPMGSKSV